MLALEVSISPGYRHMSYSRREQLKWFAKAGLTLGAAPLLKGCDFSLRRDANAGPTNIVPLPAAPTPWPTRDPFLFCVHHLDHYPEGNGKVGPKVSLDRRQLGRDFAGIDGWNMYHGREVPGFPKHPHRGFETITMVEQGFVDHTDSLGAKARYGAGDVQWLTAGKGIQHAEMFPLLNTDQKNPLELFQIWLNLPRASKFSTPHFSMFWNRQIPIISGVDHNGHGFEMKLIAGQYGDTRALKPPPSSWAVRHQSDFALATLTLSPRSRFKLPPTRPDTRRSLYFYRGESLQVGPQLVAVKHRIDLDHSLPIVLHNGEKTTKLLLAQSQAIGEPIARRGPFVMNEPYELTQAFRDYRKNQFGGWEWPHEAPTHGPAPTRFAQYKDGKIEKPPAG